MGPIISKYSHNRHVACFQEVHGNKDDLLLTFSQWLPGWSIFVSGCLDFQGFASPGSGGVVIAVCTNLNRSCSFEKRFLSMADASLCPCVLVPSVSWFILKVARY